MPKKTPPIKYTSRDFDSIKKDLIEHAKRYYSDTYKDFSEASFGSMMVDMTAYVGDILSFYLDYSVNESFIDTATEYDNVVKMAKQFGYNFKSTAVSHGILTFYVTIPANNSGAPDTSYMPILKKGTQVASGAGATFVLIEDVDFSDSDNEIVVSTTNEFGNPTYYAVRTYGRVISGKVTSETAAVGDFQKFRRLELNSKNVSEIVSVVDSEGHEYFEVENLSQNVVYLPVKNRQSDKERVPELIKPFVVPRRFTVDNTRLTTALQFGYGSTSELVNESFADPAQVILDIHGRTHVTDTSFDPAKLTSSDKFGVAPVNTTLTITYRINDKNNVNAGTDTVTSVVSPVMQFLTPAELSPATVSIVEASLECTNEEPIIGDTSIPDVTELKQRIKSHFFAQNRAVTRQDYQSLVYTMPSKFGMVERCQAIQDKNSFRRNLNLYVISKDADDRLAKSTSSLKDNIKTWLSGYKMINDTIDILDAKILNLGIEYDIKIEEAFNKYNVLAACNAIIRSYYSKTREIGEPLYITDVYKILNSIAGVIDTIDVRIVNKVGTNYSDIFIDIDDSLSSDGRVLYIPKDHIIEFKFPAQDIRGAAK